jgi:atypical dual specificity phosphatase
VVQGHGTVPGGQEPFAGDSSTSAATERIMRTIDLRRLSSVLRSIGLVVDCGDWLLPDQLVACAYPRRRAALAALAQQGVSVVINLHQRAHHPSRLGQFGLTEIHLPVADFTAPSPEQLDLGVEAIEQALAEGHRVAVHCGGGLGRTGTLLACYLIRQGMSTVDAIKQVRAVRPGSIETRDQVRAILTYGQMPHRRNAPQAT